jgi:ferric-chelate reductase (NADPH)
LSWPCAASSGWKPGNFLSVSACQFFGPRRSLDLAGLDAPVALFGGETSFGLAAALREILRAGGTLHMFEATDVTESRQVLDAVSLG